MQKIEKNKALKIKIKLKINVVLKKNVLLRQKKKVGNWPIVVINQNFKLELWRKMNMLAEKN